MTNRIFKQQLKNEQSSQAALNTQLIAMSVYINKTQQTTNINIFSRWMSDSSLEVGYAR